jgi:hypothetical protein
MCVPIHRAREGPISCPIMADRGGAFARCSGLRRLRYNRLTWVPQGTGECDAHYFFLPFLLVPWSAGANNVLHTKGYIDSSCWILDITPAPHWFRVRAIQQAKLF